jgi:hypothetical protein
MIHIPAETASFDLSSSKNIDTSSTPGKLHYFQLLQFNVIIMLILILGDLDTFNYFEAQQVASNLERFGILKLTSQVQEAFNLVYKYNHLKQQGMISF